LALTVVMVQRGQKRAAQKAKFCKFRAIGFAACCRKSVDK
jgi:hypothetical protein